MLYPIYVKMCVIISQRHLPALPSSLSPILSTAMVGMLRVFPPLDSFFQNRVFQFFFASPAESFVAPVRRIDSTCVRHMFPRCYLCMQGP